MINKTEELKIQAYKDAIDRLIDENKDLEEQLQYADSQLDHMHNQLIKRDAIIDKLLEVAKEI